MKKQSFALLTLGTFPFLPASTRADVLDFEGLTAGTIPHQLTAGAGLTGDAPGVVGVRGTSVMFGAGVNCAVVFDSSHPTGGDWDLGTPNQFYGGPGIGSGGLSNRKELGNILIIGEDLVDVAPADGLVDDPDDADLVGSHIDFDFSAAGVITKKKPISTVTVNSLVVLDVEAEQGEAGTFVELWGPGLPVNLIAIPPTGDNGAIRLVGIDLAGVSNVRVNLNGSGAVDEVVFDEDVPTGGGFCWFTTGGFLNSGLQSGGKEYTFGGNVGPPPSGALEVIDHGTGDNFHTNEVHIVDCLTIPGTGPGQPGGKKGFTTNKALFEGTGRLNGVKGFPFTGFVVDSGEPAGKKANEPDYFEIDVRDPLTNATVFFASGHLDGGNVQLHPAK